MNSIRNSDIADLKLRNRHYLSRLPLLAVLAAMAWFGAATPFSLNLFSQSGVTLFEGVLAIVGLAGALLSLAYALRTKPAAREVAASLAFLTLSMPVLLLVAQQPLTQLAGVLCAMATLALLSQASAALGTSFLLFCVGEKTRPFSRVTA